MDYRRLPEIITCTPRAIDEGIEEAIHSAREFFERSDVKQRFFAFTDDIYKIGMANYHSLVAIAKKVGVPLDNPLVIEAEDLHERAYVGRRGFFTSIRNNYTIGRACYYLSTAINEYLDKE